MPKLSGRYFWFRLALVLGSLLGVLLLVESVLTYYHVSRFMVAGELRREAQRQINLLARDAFQSGPPDEARLQQAAEELRSEAASRIAWVRIIDGRGRVLAQSGIPVGSPPPIRQTREEDEGVQPQADIRQTPQGPVMVVMLPLRARRTFGEPGVRPVLKNGSPQLPQLPARGPELNAPGAAKNGSKAPTPPPLVPRPEFFAGLRMVEIGLYMNSASATYGSLLTNLIISSSAAIGLVASMILLWARFPNYVRGKQLEKQTELARQVQHDLLPPPDLKLGHLEFAAQCISAWQVGGDFYDIFATGDGRVAIALGDVSGKGLPASVVAGLLLGAIRSSNWMNGPEEHTRATRQLSELLRMRTSIERFASLFWCCYDPAARTLNYVNAGHLPPLVLSRNGDGTLKNHTLDQGGPVLGVIADPEYTQGSVHLPEGGLMVLYSDGVVEATNSQDEQFGEERLRAAIERHAHLTAAEIRDLILEQVQAFLGKERAQDDLTLVVARFNSI